MAYVGRENAPKPNMNREYNIDVTLGTDGNITIYDISRSLSPYNGRDRDNRLERTTHEIHGDTASVYIIDDYKILTRKQAIVLAGRFINGDYNSHRLD